MAIQAKTLAIGTIEVTSPKKIYGTSATPIPKAALVTNLRLFNTTSSPVTLNLYFVPKDTSANQTSLTGKRWLLPVDFSIPPNMGVIEDVQLTLTAGDSLNPSLPNESDAIYAVAGTANAINFVVSGMEKEL